MKFLQIALVLLVMGPQATPGALTLPPHAKAKAEDQVAKQFESSRKSGGLSMLKRTPASVVEIQLACTAAITGKKVRDPRYGGLTTYVTSDLSSESGALTSIASDRDKGLSRYSVVVNSDSTSTPETIRYRVTIEVRSSWVTEFFAPITYDNPIKDSNDWKDQVALPCRKITR